MITQADVDGFKKTIKWAPSEQQIKAAMLIANKSQTRANSQRYSLYDFIRDIEFDLYHEGKEQFDHDDQEALHRLGVLPVSHYALLYAYGQNCKWTNMSTQGFSKWKTT